MLFRLIIFLHLIIFSVSAALGYCKYLPYQHAQVEIPVEAGYTSIPKSFGKNLVLHVVNYDSNIHRKIPHAPDDPRLHTHIWLVNKKDCKKILVLPIPNHASINVDGIEMNADALPVKLRGNGNLDVKYAFATAENPHKIIIRNVIVNKDKKIESVKNISLNINADVRDIVKHADWDPNGQLIDFAEPIENNQFRHHTIVFTDKFTRLHRYVTENPEAKISSDGFLYDQSRPYYSGRYHPRYVVVTAFDPTMQYYRQYTTRRQKPENYPLRYLIPLTKKGRLIYKIDSRIINNLGVILEQTKKENKVLSDYNKKDQLMAEHFNSYQHDGTGWQKNIKIRPKKLQANDIIHHRYQWP